MKKKTINITVQVTYSNNELVYSAFLLSMMELLKLPNFKTLIEEKEEVNVRIRPIECNEG